jgi:ABC-type glutathione transport system ATPase component
MLSVRNLSVQFSGRNVEVSALNDVSFEIFAGEILGVLGESGSGKTTLGSAIVALLPLGGRISAGSIRFLGEELIGLPDHKLQKIRGRAISTISQEPRIALNPVMRVGTQVSEVIRAHHNWSSSECRQQAKLLLMQVKLDAEVVYSAFPHQLSGGQCQRVAIAQALACNPELVIADEPTSSLDTTVQAEILVLMADLSKQRRIAFLLITHNPAILAKLADRILVMNAGKIVEQGLANDVIRHPKHSYTKTLLNSRAEMIRTASSAVGS